MTTENLLGDAGAGDGDAAAVAAAAAAGAGDSAAEAASAAAASAAAAEAAKSTNVFITNDNWKDALDEDIKTDPSLSAILDIPNLAKSYVNAQKMIGADKIQVPNKYDDGSQLRQVLHKLGLPEKAEDYEVKSAKENHDADLLKQFSEKAHTLGVLPQQSQDLYDWFENLQDGSDADFAKQAQEANEAEIADLKKEWGAAYVPNLGLANQALKHFSGDDAELHNEISAKYGSDPTITKFLAKIGDSLKEGRIIKGGNDDPFAITAQSAQDKADEMLGDRTHPLHDKNHPKHAAALKEYSKYTEIAGS